MLKLIGVCLIVLGAGGFGVKKAINFYRQIQQLREFSHALELLKCEMNYTLLPVPKLCRMTAERLSGAGAEFLRFYAQALDEDKPRTLAAQFAFARTRGLQLPKNGQMAVLELFGSLGRYDLDGENRLLDLTRQRLLTALECCEKEKKPLAKGYAALGLCTGAALAILLV